MCSPTGNSQCLFWCWNTSKMTPLNVFMGPGARTSLHFFIFFSQKWWQTNHSNQTFWLSLLQWLCNWKWAQDLFLFVKPLPLTPHLIHIFQLISVWFSVIQGSVTIKLWTQIQYDTSIYRGECDVSFHICVKSFIHSKCILLSNTCILTLMYIHFSFTDMYSHFHIHTLYSHIHTYILTLTYIQSSFTDMYSHFHIHTFSFHIYILLSPNTCFHSHIYTFMYILLSHTKLFLLIYTLFFSASKLFSLTYIFTLPHICILYNHICTF